jgi:hypothetical protein
MAWAVDSLVARVFTDLGFTRDRLYLTPKSAKADLGGEPEAHFAGKRYDAILLQN